MKLYAKVQSERATKGQGGEHLHIEITGEDKKTVIFEVNAKMIGDWYIIDGYAIHKDHTREIGRRSEQYRFEIQK